jgi:hypothetical protein
LASKVIGEASSTPSSKKVWTRFWVTSAPSHPNALTWCPGRGVVIANGIGAACSGGTGSTRRPKARWRKPDTEPTRTRRRTPLASTKWKVAPANGVALVRLPMQLSPVRMNSDATKVAAQLAAGAVAVDAPDPGAGGGRGAGELGLVDAEVEVGGVGVVETRGDQRPGAKDDDAREGGETGHGRPYSIRRASPGPRSDVNSTAPASRICSRARSLLNRRTGGATVAGAVARR